MTFTFGYGGTRFASFEPAFFAHLSNVTGNSTWVDEASVEFFDRLTADTYGDSSMNGCGPTFPGNTHDYIARHKCLRSGGLINLRPWDMQYMPWIAGIIGNSDSAPGDGISQQTTFLNDSILDGLNTLDSVNPGVNPAYYGEVIGLAGAVHALALNGTTSFPAINAPNYAAINGMTTLCALADHLASLQDASGAWTWTANLNDPSDRDSQTTAYAILALLAAQNQGCGPYGTQIANGRAWLWTMQDPSDGGFYDYPGGMKNIEANAEIVSALGVIPEVSLNSSACATTGTVTVTIDMSDVQSNPIVGGQFFLEYNTTVLSFDSASPGSAPFTLEVYESVNTGTGTIDYAVGVPGAGPGTTSATTMAVLTFNALQQVCDTANLVKFRAHMPPTRLTDDQGNSIVPSLTDLPAITIDSTPPVITCPPNIVVNADAGGCTAEVLILPSNWALFFNAGISATGDPSNPYALELRSVASDPSPTFAAAAWTPPAPLTFAGLTNLSADYSMPTGCFAGGSPRFQVRLDTNNDNIADGNVFVYWGTVPNYNDCPTPGWHNTGDLINDGAARFDTTQFPGGAFYSTHAQAVALLGGATVMRITAVVDASWSQDQVVYVDNVNINGSLHSFGDASATDNCDSAPNITAVRSDSLPLSDPYPTGVTTITWTATDDCGNFSQCFQTVTVNAYNTMVVDLQLAGSFSTTFTRCIRFELSSGGPGTTIVDQNVTFVNGVANNVEVNVPCGLYTCITARDRKHTLRRTDSAFAIVGVEYVADFTGGDALVGGNLNDDSWIDILDFGIFVGQFGTSPGANTLCGYVGNHADISGDGTVNVLDFNFISLNFLQGHEANCSGVSGLVDDSTPAETAGPIQRISVRELIRRGWRDAVAGDLNHDGWLDANDIAQFLNGQ